MNTDLTRHQQIVASLGDKEYRDEFVESTVAAVVAFQVRAIREMRGWTQQELGDVCGTSQEWISTIENPQYGRHSMQTLLALAHAFDCWIDVRFRPFSDMAFWLSNRQPNDLMVAKFAEDKGLLRGPMLIDATSGTRGYKSLRAVVETQTTQLADTANDFSSASLQLVR